MFRPDTFSTTLRRAFAALLLGAAGVTAFAPLDWFPVIWLALAGLYGLLGATADKSGRARDGALIGGAFGFGLFITGTSWIHISLSVFGGMPVAVSASATLIFCAFLALYPALVGALFVRFAPAARWRRGLFFAGLWTLSEWLRGWLLTGFPWLAVGYAQTPPSPLAGFAPVAGVFGISLLTAVLATLIHAAIRRSRPGLPGAPLLGILVLLAGGGLLRTLPWTVPSGEPMSVALLQGNIPQDMKWVPEKFSDSLLTYYDLMRENPAQLTILPETALPVFLADVPERYLEEMTKLAGRENGNLLFGIVTGDMTRYSNSAISVGAAGIQFYHKSHLVPFGEITPPGFSWFLAMANIPMSDFTPGADKQAPIVIDGQKIAANICYEDAFGEEIIRALPEATLLINISNVAWFGDSLAPAQHLQISRMRALETGRMMLRATNTGMTAIIDAQGDLQGVLEPFTRGALRGKIRAYTGSTPYVRWGNWPAMMISLLLTAFMARRKPVS